MLAAVPVSAQVGDALLSKVEAVASVNTSYGSDFVEVRKAKDGKVVKNCKGSFTYDKKGSIVMTYTDPEGELFKVADGKMNIIRDGKTQNLDSKKVPLAKKMSESLICLFEGKVKQAAEIQKAEYKVEDMGETYVATLTAKTKAVKGYGKTRVTYSKKDGHVIEMYLEEFNGNSSTYSL